MNPRDTQVIAAATVGCKTMADGTLRLSVDIEPRDARAAFVLFGTPGQGVGLAALRPQISPTSDPLPERVVTDAQRVNWDSLGQKTKAAISIGGSPDFWDWVGVTNAKDAGQYIKDQCGIASRKELDEPGEAQDRFNTLLRQYRAYTEKLYGQGRQD